MKKYILVLLLSAGCKLAFSQTVIPKYPMVFRFRIDSVNVRDTSVTAFQLDYWKGGTAFPARLQWSNTSFQLTKNLQDSLDLGTDSVTSYNTGDVVGYAYYKIGSSGTFRFDYKITNIGRYINHSSSAANLDVVQTPQGILLKAHSHIAPNTPFKVDYNDLTGLFPGDPTIQMINY